MNGRAVALAALTLTAACSAPEAAAPHADADARLRARALLHRLGYLDADYPRAVVAGQVVSQAEHEEHVALATAAADDARALAGASGGEDALVVEAERLRERVAAAAPERDVAASVRRVEFAAIGVAELDLAPAERPDRERGRHLYGELCAPCHGTRGHPDRSLARTMLPPPVDFFDPGVVEPLSPARVALAVEFGVEGAAMPAFPTTSDRDRADLGAFVLTLRNSTRTSPRTPRFAPAELAAQTDGELLDGLYAAGAEQHEVMTMLAELRTQVAYADPTTQGPFGQAREALFRASQRIVWEDRVGAAAELARAARACRGPVRGAVAALAPALAIEIDERLLALRGRLRTQAPADDLGRDVDVLAQTLTRAQLELAGAAPPPPRLGVPLTIPERPLSEWFAAGAKATLHAAAVPALAVGALAPLRKGRPLAALIVAGAACLPTASSLAAIASELGVRGAAGVFGVALALVVLALVALALSLVVAAMPRRASTSVAVAVAMALAAWLAGQVVWWLETAGLLARRPLGWIGAPDFSLFPSLVACVAEGLAAAVVLGVAVGRVGRRRS